MATPRGVRGKRSATGDPCAAFRALALSMGGAVEMDHFGRPSFRAPRVPGAKVKPGSKAAATLRIFATLWPDEQKAVLMLTPEQQVEWEDRHPAFSAVPNKWGDMGATFVQLAGAGKVKAIDLQEAVKAAWTNVAVGS